MSAILIARHEWRRLRVQPFAWLLAAAVVALMAWQFLLALQGFIDLAPQLGGLQDAPGVTRLVSVPLLRASGTSALRIVLGKFAGAFGFVLALCLPVAAMALSPALGTDLDGGHLAAALLGLALFAGALTAIGVLASAWAAQPALAAALALAITGLLAVVDAGARLQGVSNGAINYLALPTHLEPFFRGIVASVDAGYFVLLAAVALALAARRLDALRGRAG